MAVLPQPPYPYQPGDPTWENFFLSLASISTDAAPIDARYLVTTTNPDLDNEINLGLLGTGLLFLTVAAGIATPSTLALLSLVRGGTGADLSLTGGASQVLRQSTAGGVVTVSRLDAADLSDVVAGSYTPTLTNVTNLAASTAYACQYLRVGGVVFVSGKVDVDPTASGAVELGIALPVASDFATAEQCAGAAASPAVSGLSAAILADATNNRASMQWVAVDTANRTLAFSFQYRVI